MTSPLFVEAYADVAARHGDRLALVDEAGATLTHGALLERARRLASGLRTRGIAPGELVALAMPKSIDFVVAMLACWIARAAWVPIDPSLPAARRAWLLGDARPRLTLDHDEDGAGPVLALDPGAPDELAYLMYTSGSTGVPKGVRVAHRGLVPMLTHQIASFGLAPGKQALLHLSTSFDAAISDVGTSLLSGATLHLHDTARDATIEHLLDVLERRAITHVDLPPSLLARIEPSALPRSVETIVIGGEVCPIDVVRAFASRVRLVNVYGPTEATICTSLVVCDPQTWSRASIGAPIPGIAYDVVDDALVPVPTGVPGELLIRGAGLALGYLNRPELERARFVETPAGRAYRTGDRVVRHEDGDLEMLGRVDRQLKVRGQLVAPEEIEACLARHPDVVDVAVVHRAIADDHHGLVAFLVERGAPTSSLRAHVLGQLPRWMCPSRFERVESLPRTLAGKVDLPALAARPLSRRDAEAPRDARERSFCALFAAVLGLDDVSRDDDFFALGGTSLDVLQLLAAAEARGIPLSAETVYERSTVTGLAAASLLPDRATARALSDDARRVARAVAVIEPTGEGDEPLLTGATGFLGARVLHTLLGRDEHQTVACLVRGENDRDARARVHAAVARHGLALDDRRVRIVLGDVRRRCFGLDEASFAALRARTSCVHHLAADVNLVLPYARVRDTNVLGAAHVRALGRPVHHASTLSVLACASPRTRHAMEKRALSVEGDVLGGYAQSKWVAEGVLHDARTTVRFGLLTGDSRSGVGAPSCQLMTFARGLARLGVFPEDGCDGLAIDVTPVDFAADAWVALTTRAHLASDEGTFHVAGARSLRLDELVQALRAWGIPLRPTSREDFRRRVAEHEIDRTLATTFLGAFRRMLGQDERHAASDVFLATDMTFDGTRAEPHLRGARPPPPDRALLFRYFDAALGGGS